jgi:hypothetical protein
MRVVLLRVGIDSGSGGIQGPLFEDRSFELIPIPDGFGGLGVNPKTYGNTHGRKGRLLIEYFPDRLRKKMSARPVHDDPEFDSFTYGDPTFPKRGLRKLEKGDLLVFYVGLEGWNIDQPPALYIVGYFEVEVAGLAKDFGSRGLRSLFAKNFHVRHRRVFEDQRQRLVLVKGGKGSRLLKNAKLISSLGRDRNGKPIKVLSPAMRKIFGEFHGRVSIQRSPPRWVEPAFVKRAAEFVSRLE